MSQLIFVIVIVVAWVGFAVFAVGQPKFFEVPPQWLDSWTKLIATVVTAAVGARVLWGVPKFLDTFTRQQELANQRQQALLQELLELKRKP